MVHNISVLSLFPMDPNYEYNHMAKSTMNKCNCTIRYRTNTMIYVRGYMMSTNLSLALLATLYRSPKYPRVRVNLRHDGGGGGDQLEHRYNIYAITMLGIHTKTGQVGLISIKSYV